MRKTVSDNIGFAELGLHKQRKKNGNGNETSCACVSVLDYQKAVSMSNICSACLYGEVNVIIEQNAGHEDCTQSGPHQHQATL